VKQARAAQIAARIVTTHGNTITAEDCRIATWARLWVKRIAVFSPGMLVTAHDCPHCGLHADRDIVSATLAA
jgi:hypothetical protein